MTPAEAKIFAAELRTDLPNLDLHGLYTYEAQEKIEIFLYKQVESGENACQIIYGFGTGALREATLRVLRHLNIVGIVKEQGGKCLVILNLQ